LTDARTGTIYRAPTEDEGATDQGDKEIDPHLVSLSPCLSEVLDLTADWPTIAQQPTTDPRSASTAANLAYVLYTSGSTGTPKAVLVSHANVCRLFAATQPTYQFSAEDVWTLFHSAAFDFSVWELWGAL